MHSFSFKQKNSPAPPQKKRFLAAVLGAILSFCLYAEADPQLHLTEEETEFLREHPVLTVVCDPNWAPLEYYSTARKKSEYSGITISVLRRMGELLGTELVFIPTENYFQSVDLIQTGHADIITGYSSRLRLFSDINYTGGFFSVPFVLASMDGRAPSPGDVIALSTIDGKELLSLYQLYPPHEYRYQFHETPEEALRRFSSGKCNFIVANTYELSDHADIDGNYLEFPLNISYLQQFGVSPRLGQEAVGALTKAYRHISSQEFDQLVRTSQTERQNMLNAAVWRKQLYIAISVVATLLLLLALGGTAITLSMKRKIRSIEYDELTNTPTFAKFKHDVRLILSHAKPNEYIFLSLDIDDFKFINDSYGFSKGNLLLVELSQHFMDELKSKEMVCRFYADNFIFFMRNPGLLPLIEDQVFQLSNVDERIKMLLPEGHPLKFSTSVYYITDPQGDIASMIDKANLARKVGKKRFSTHRVTEYTKEMDNDNEWKKEITLTMNKAVENQEFKVYYQPKFRFSDARIIGAEALVRWENPKWGLLSPDRFIPLFENNGFIQKIDFYVFNEVCSLLDSWSRSGPNGTCPEPLTISFNLSRYHLYNPDLINDLTEIVNRYSITPCHIEVELTETIMFDNQKRLVKTMNEIKKAGFTISVDDFGSGYSSLNLLKDMPADVLKLDKQFLSNVPENTKESIIINSVIEMAKKLKLTTVAEGVETKKQSDLLRDMGCDIAQGFYYARPMPQEEFIALLKKSFLIKDLNVNAPLG